MNGIRENATCSGLSAGVRTVTGSLTALLGVRLVGGESYGQLVTMLSLFTLLLSLNVSIYTAMVPRLHFAFQNDTVEESIKLISVAKMVAVISIGILALLLYPLSLVALHWILGVGIEVPNRLEVLVFVVAMGILTAIQMLIALNSAIVESFGRLDLSTKWQLFGPVIVVLTLLPLWIAGIELFSTAYVAILCAGAVVDFVLITRVRRKLLIPAPPMAFSMVKLLSLWSLLKSGFTLQGATLMTLFLEPINKLMLNHFIGSLAVTAYDLAMKIVWGIQHLFTAAMRVFLHLSCESEAYVIKAIVRVLNLVIVPVLVAHILGAVFIAGILHYWVEIGKPDEIMLFFAIATLSNLGMIYITPLYISLIGRGDLRFIFKSQGIVAVTNVAASLVIIPKYGLVGAAIGLLCATAYNVIAIYRRHERLVARCHGFSAMIRSKTSTFTVVVLLFLESLVLGGIEPPVDLLAFGFILLLSGIIVFLEPLFWELLKEAKKVI